MNKKEVYLGIDTSCYTTSVALIDKEGNLVDEARIVLDVKSGHCGLMQSEMVFQHTKNLPKLMERIFNVSHKIVGIAASSRPRSLAESYMPAFLVGVGLARSLAVASDVPLWPISHQENHLEAGRWSAKGPQTDRFLLLHISGGTTELLLATNQDKYNTSLERIGGSIDLQAGQFIDRIGVALNLQFPTGALLEKLALTAKTKIELPIAVQKNNCSLSGPATAALRKLKANADPAALAAGVQYTLAESFARMISNAALEYNIKNVLLVGGVASNTVIREHLIEKLGKSAIKVYIPESRFSSDNAVGCAAYAYRRGETSNG